MRRGTQNRGGGEREGREGAGGRDEGCPWQPDIVQQCEWLLSPEALRRDGILETSRNKGGSQRAVSVSEHSTTRMSYKSRLRAEILAAIEPLVRPKRVGDCRTITAQPLVFDISKRTPWQKSASCRYCSFRRQVKFHWMCFASIFAPCDCVPIFRLLEQTLERRGTHVSEASSRVPCQRLFPLASDEGHPSPLSLAVWQHQSRPPRKSSARCAPTQPANLITKSRIWIWNRLTARFSQWGESRFVNHKRAHFYEATWNTRQKPRRHILHDGVLT